MITMYSGRMYVKKTIYRDGKEILNDLYIEVFGYTDRKKLDCFKNIEVDKISEVEKEFLEKESKGEDKKEEGALIKKDNFGLEYFNYFLRSLLDWVKKKYYKKRKYRRKME